MSNTAFSVTYSLTTIKLRFSDQKTCSKPGLIGLSWALLGVSWGSLGLSWGSLGVLGLSQALLGSSKIIAKNSTGSPQGDPDLFFAMIFEHVFFDAQKSLQKTIQDRPRAPRGGLRRRLGPVSDLSWAVLGLSWACLGLSWAQDGPR